MGSTCAGWDALWAGFGSVKQRAVEDGCGDVPPWLPEERQEWHHTDSQHNCRHLQPFFCTPGPVMCLLCRNRKDKQSTEPV